MIGTGRGGLLALLLLAPVAAGVPAAASPSSPSPSAGAGGTEQLPVAGTFELHARQNDTLDDLRGAVHAVRRVPGGTAVYYSVGAPAGQRFSAVDFLPPPNLGDDYRPGAAGGVGLVDTQNLQYLQPMVGADGCLCPMLGEFGDESGVLHVGWAVMPPLPADVDTVGVAFGFGNQVEDVPVGDGQLAPAVEQASTVLGQGWPALPDDAAIASVPDPARYVRALVRNIADLEGTVTSSEQPGAVAENLASDVLFTTDSATLTPAARDTLEQVAGRLRERAVGQVAITGHADSTGTPAVNLPLSVARAEAVRAALQPLVEPGTVLTATGVGEREPVADNATPEGRAQNRRVTVAYAVAEGS